VSKRVFLDLTQRRGPTLRLTKDDVADLTDPRIKPRNVKPGNGYQIKCPVTTAGAVDLAVELTLRALAKVHRPGR
jgi:hypothetical protein